MLVIAYQDKLANGIPVFEYMLRKIVCSYAYDFKLFSCDKLSSCDICFKPHNIYLPVSISVHKWGHTKGDQKRKHNTYNADHCSR